MPELGGIGRGLRKGAQAARDKAKEKAEEALRRRRADEPEEPNEDGEEREPAAEVALADEPDRPEDLADEPDEPDEPDEAADDAEVADLVARLKSLVDSRRPGPGPVTERWSLGVGDLLAEHPRVPRPVRGLVRRLDRFGGLAITPDTIAFDGDDVNWSDVTEVRTRHLADYLLGDAVQRQVENLPLPRFPGRRRLLDGLGKAVLTVTIAMAKEQLDNRGLDLRVPAEIEYRGALRRRRTLSPGVLGAVVLADPAVNASLVATARAKGIAVTAGQDDDLVDAEARAAALRAKIAALETELARFSQRFGRQR